MAADQRSGEADRARDHVETLQLWEEQATVSRRSVAGSTVRVSTATETHEQLIDEMLLRVSVEIERVPVGRVVETVPSTRQEGDTTIVPVVEEVLVLERRLILKEEVPITRVRTTQAHRETVQLRHQVATIHRDEGEPVALPAGEPDA